MRNNSPFCLLFLAAACMLLAPRAQASPLQDASADTSPAATPTTDVSVTVNTLADRHPISPYIYGANFPPSESYISTGGVTLSRWGGNNASRYNWKLNAKNDDNDWYFENYSWGTPNWSGFITSAVAGGGSPIMTIPMLSWVAKDTTSWSFSVKKYGSQCSVNPYNTDAGDGVLPDCSTDLTGNDPTDANTRLFDKPSSGDPEGTVYRGQWIDAIKPLYKTQPHFYQLDNEPEIWGGTHRDVHPDPTGYDELAGDIVQAGHAIKSFDPEAMRFAPVNDSWWFYWNGANSNDKPDHGGLDFLPWILDEIHDYDVVAGSRSFDIFDVHAYFNGPPTNGMTTAQVRAAALRETRDWWDPTYISESGTVNQPWCTSIQPDKTIAFVIPRMRAMANSIYPGTPVSFTEWNGALAGESDFSTALVDADTYGILGKERMWGASRWVASDPTTAAYQALLLYRNANGRHLGFETLSVAATSNASPDLFAAYAATDPAGERLTLMVINKDPVNQARVTFTVDNFTPAKMTAYTLSQASPTAIKASRSETWSDTQTFAPYTATLIVASGKSTKSVAEEWDLNPDTLLAPLSGEVTIAPTLKSGTGTVTLTSASGTGGLRLALTQPKITKASTTTTGNGLITIRTPATPGLYSFAVNGRDSGGTAQTQHGWVLATVQASTLTKTGDNQTAAPGATITLTANYTPGPPPSGATGPAGATAGGVDLLFTTSAGKLSERIVRTNGNGEATVNLTLPSKAGKVTVTAVGPVFWGSPAVTFTETVQ
jgi:hypothetical protein